MTRSNPADIFQSIVKPGVKGIQPYQPGKPVEELERELGVINAVKLASNENPLGVSPLVKQALDKAVKDLTRYPDGSAFYLKKKLASRLGVRENQLTIGNGSNEVLELLARMFLSPTTSAVVSAHAFVVYDLAITAESARAIKVPAKDWGHDITAMADAVDDSTRMVFIANPNNPTGTWVSHSAIRGLLESVSGQVIVVVDEAYFEYVDKPDYQSSLSLLDEFPNLVVTRTFSKAYGLAALRVGYAISHPALADLMNRLRQPFNVNSFALAAAEAALEDKQFLADSIEVNRAGYEQLSAGLKGLGISFIPSAGNFIAAEFGEDAADIYEQLLRAGVIVRPIAGYAMPRHLRISIGTESENVRFLDTLTTILSAGEVA
ncbi:MAG: histidinol-phosphate transaminase [bacterium]